MFEEELLEKAAACEEILRDARNELYLSMRFMDVALSSLRFSPTYEVTHCGTDGVAFYYEIPYLAEQYRVGNVMVNRMYLHSVLHCLFGHVYKKRPPAWPQDESQNGAPAWPQDGMQNGAPAWSQDGMQNGAQTSLQDESQNGMQTSPQEVFLWDLACDIAMESVIDSLALRCVRLPGRPYRRAVYEGLHDKARVLTAESVYRLLRGADLDPRAIARLRLEFAVDDHRRWPGQQERNAAGMPNEQFWRETREKMLTELETFSKEASEEEGGLREQLAAEGRERYDYREFLRKFCVLKEEMQVDLDSFDYIFYHYGMELYGNMPLIEPQETKETQKIEDFVIAIDTSMSCKRSLILQFLEETYSILSQSESFYRRFRVHIIQCDERVQSDTVVTDREELRRYMEHFEVRGLGGTDFRPVFSYVQRLLREKEFTKLKGLIYFTDGYGRYPLKKPPYDTAFVFFREDYQDVDVPPWAIKLILGEEDIIGEREDGKV